MLSEQSKTVNDGGRSKPSVWKCSEVIFRDAEKCRTSRHCTRKTSLHPEGGGNPLPMVADWEILSNRGSRGSLRIADKQKPKTRAETLK